MKDIGGPKHKRKAVPTNKMLFMAILGVAHIFIIEECNSTSLTPHACIQACCCRTFMVLIYHAYHNSAYVIHMPKNT